MARTKITRATKRPVPRPFAFEWARGQVVEEASVKVKMGDHSWEPTLQLLRFEDGSESLRLCVFHGKRFSRMPLIVSPGELSALYKEAARHRGIKAHLKKSSGAIR